MSLQDQLLADFGETLLDSDGPAQQAVVNGKAIMVVIDRPTLNETDPRTGITIHRLTLYARQEDLGFVPVAGQDMEIDGEHWIIDEPCPHGKGVLQLGMMRYLA